MERDREEEREREREREREKDDVIETCVSARRNARVMRIRNK